MEGSKMRLTTILRLGLRQFAAGMLSVLALGILNRVMHLELGVALGVVALVVGSQEFVAPVAIPIGHRSDRRPYFGLHRTPYILGGALLVVVTVILAPWLAFWMAEQQASPVTVVAGLALFLAMGVGTYTAGTAYLSLIADLTTEEERGRVIAIVWAMLMLGILAGVFLGVSFLEQYTPQGLVSLFLVGAGIYLVCTVVAVWGLEPRGAAVAPSSGTVGLRRAVAIMAANRQVQLFFGFMVCSQFFMFLQQVVLEPFGGRVFGMSVGETTRFNAFQMAGVLTGMGLAGAFLTRRLGLRRTAALGAAVAAAAFFLLALTAVAVWVEPVRPAILIMGLGLGIFTVGGIALMMGMAAPGQVGLYMGAWTMAQALARGFANLGGGALHDLALALSGQVTLAYAFVFALEGLGLLVAIGLLMGVDVAAFQAEAQRVSVSETAIPEA
jgi:BCD family chlorophyll transporter-like MFS transporter